MVRWVHSQLERLRRDRHGASAIEYCLLAALVAIFIMSTVNFLSTQINIVQETVTNAVQDG